ncbi:acetaldehyde dehydrogenase (acetylating) [Marinobacterium rhizophilum]|uniref:Acetaldehyde dehydrogenase n=1 Tax=Marinobacterium rhizophilum TaxID=420402 RepID=A0ABY5HI03_9GAMM|nr:acetaldehyde dehydrogenase (acetylating) [Marinobacterium rhizophilum]UTW12016.1 acetaldehyde dehydrogenase (acetylating) [Marinobacterium rhizophilum]
MGKVKVAIIGPGNIGTDLMYKVIKNDYLEMGAMIGIVPESEGLRRAQDMGITTSAEGIDFLKSNPDCAEIIFDATTASAHEKFNAPVINQLGKIAIDLTPAAVGKIVSPVVNMHDCLGENNVNLITCGGQATTPIVYTISQHVGIKYAEVVTTVASKSAGPGTRANIDEYSSTTAKALTTLGGADTAKVFTVFNPAEPASPMRNTIFCEPRGEFDIQVINTAVTEMVMAIQEYVPGYELTMEPIVNNGVITTTVSVSGAGDFLPSYAGNLDMETSSAIKVAEEYAKKLRN